MKVSVQVSYTIDRQKVKLSVPICDVPLEFGKKKALRFLLNKVLEQFPDDPNKETKTKD